MSNHEMLRAAFGTSSVYTNQMWADGIYMAEPFLVQYGNMLDDATYAIEEATKQVTLLAEHAYDTTSHLLYHGWDETFSCRLG